MKGLKRPKSKLHRYLQAAFVVVVVVFFAFALYRNWSDVVRQPWQLQYGWLAAALLLTLASSLFYVLIWRILLSLLGGSTTYRQAFTVMSLAYLARYIPGSFWSILGAVYLGKKEGLDGSLASVSLVLHLMTQLIAAVLVVIISVPFWSGADGTTLAYALVPAVSVGLILLHPFPLNRLFALASRLAKRTPSKIDLSYRNALLILGLWMSYWLINGLAGAAMIYSLHPSPPDQLPAIIGIFTLSWVASFLVFLAPSGLGVMEGTLALLISLSLPPHVAVMVAVLARVLKTVNDLLCAGAAWALRRRQGNTLQSYQSAQSDQDQ